MGTATRRWASVLVVATAGLVGLSPPPASAQVPAPDRGAVRSVVVLGDSVAAGEGAADGYVYRNRLLFPSWTTDRRVPGPGGPACGRSDQSYGVLVAAALDAEVTNLACSGASFERGIELDARYDRARPDLVLVTAGANSVAFERAFAYCVLAARGVSGSEAARIARASTVRDAVVTAVELATRRLLGSSPRAGAPSCTDARPGAYLQRTVLDRAGEVGAAARDLAADIRSRGRALGTVPEVVFTTYANPLPAAAESLAECPDAAGLEPAQLAFLHQMLDRLNDALRAGLAGAPGVRVAEPDPAFAGHRWCSAEPWVYGPSIFVADPSSRVPFHPTPAGQRAYAESVLATRRALTTDGRGFV